MAKKGEWEGAEIFCVGTSPLLANPMSLMQKFPASLDDRISAMTALMKSEDGQFGFPLDWLWYALKSAGRYVNFRGYRLSKLSGESELPKLLRINEVGLAHNAEMQVLVPFSEQAEPIPWINSCMAKFGTVPVVKLQFNTWSFRILMDVQVGFSPVLSELITLAGHYQGIGTNRPGSGGEFGTFALSELHTGLLVPA